MYARGLQPADEIARPSHRYGAARERILQDQTPADDPRRRLAEYRVRVRTARRRYQSCELGISERSARANDSGNEKREDDCGAGSVGADAGQRIDAGADDRTDPERHQMRPAQRLLQRATGLMRPADLERLTWTPDALNV